MAVQHREYWPHRGIVWDQQTPDSGPVGWVNQHLAVLWDGQRTRATNNTGICRQTKKLFVSGFRRDLPANARVVGVRVNILYRNTTPTTSACMRVHAMEVRVGSALFRRCNQAYVSGNHDNWWRHGSATDRLGLPADAASWNQEISVAYWANFSPNARAEVDVAYLDVWFEIPAGPTVSLTGNGSSGPLTLASGSNVALAWTSANATALQGEGHAAWVGAKAIPSGSQTITNLTVSSTFIITATGAGGTVNSSVVVNITGAGEAPPAPAAQPPAPVPVHPEGEGDVPTIVPGTMDGFTFGGVHSSSFHCLLLNAPAPAGQRSDLERLERARTDGVLLSSMTIKEMELPVEFTVSGDTIQQAEQRLDEVSLWLFPRRNRMLKPRLRWLVFDHAPHKAYQAIVASEIERDRHGQAIKCKTKFLVPEGIAWDMIPIVTGPQGANTGIVKVRPVIVISALGGTHTFVELVETHSQQRMRINFSFAAGTIITINCRRRTIRAIHNNVLSDFTNQLDLSSVWFNVLGVYEFTATGATIQEIKYFRGY